MELSSSNDNHIKQEFEFCSGPEDHIKKEISTNKDKKKSDKILEIKTIQTRAFKQAIKLISKVISDCCIVFIPPEDSTNQDDDDYEQVQDLESNKPNSKASSGKPTRKKNPGGIRILRLNEEKTILIKMNLDAHNFEYYKCDSPKITIGVDMHNFHSSLKKTNDDDPIILYMNRDNRSALYVRNSNENNENSEETDIEIRLIDMAYPDFPLSPTEFQNEIAMASYKFRTICKYLNNDSTTVEITSINNEILFRGKNDEGKVTMSYKDNSHPSRRKNKAEQIVQGEYELKNLMVFSKCNKMCDIIEIYLKNEFPLVLVISVATIGKMYVFLYPVENPSS